MTASALEALVVGNEDFETIENTLDVFCPFEAVGMVRQEVRHAYFLSHCIDPQRPHGFAAECLRAFMRSAAQAKREWEQESASEDLTSLDVHLMELDSAQVRREWRKIDLLVTIPQEKLVVAAELKIDSGEHSGQLRRYRQIVIEQWPTANGWRHLFLFLTKRGEPPSEADGEDWIPVDMRSLARELDSVVKRQTGTPEARALLASYLSMLRRHHLQNERLEELAARLWSQHREALEFLMEQQPERADGVFGLLYEHRAELAQLMSEASGTTVVLDDSTRNNIRFAVPSWDQYNCVLRGRDWTSSNRLLLIELAPSGDKRSVRMRFVIGSGDQEARRAIYDALDQAGLTKRGRRQFTGTWTRLATETLMRELDEPDADPQEALENIKAAVCKYAKTYIPAYGAAIAGAKIKIQLGEPVR